jgi:low temperature requirement protein LtrA
MPPVANREQRVGWLELFFDLVFVVSIAQLTELGEAAPGVPSILLIAAVLIPVWMTWNNTTLYVNVSGGVSVRERLLVFGAMAGVAMMAIAIPTITDAGQPIFAIGYAVARTAMWPLWGHEQVIAPLRGWGPFLYGPVFAVLWVGGIAVPAPYRLIVWGVLLVVELVWVLALLPSAPHDSGHMIERVGLFIMIVLGESVFILVRAVAERSTPAVWIVAAITFATICGLWWRYSDLSTGMRERMLARDSGAIFRDVLVIAHFFVVLGLVLLAAGFGIAITHADSSRLPVGALVVLLTGLAVFEASQLFMAARFAVRPVVALVKALPSLVVIAVFATLGSGWPPVVVTGAVLLGTVAEIVLSTALKGLALGEVRPSPSSPTAAAPRS